MEEVSAWRGWAIGFGGDQRLGLEHRSRTQCWGRVSMMFAKKKDDMKVSQRDNWTEWM